MFRVRKKSIIWLVALMGGAAVLSPSSADECLLTPAGTPLKVIVKSNTAMHREPELTTATEPIAMFSFFYVLPAVAGGTEQEQDGFVRVGTAASVAHEAGWIPVKDIVYWPHAQVVGFRRSADRERMLFFASEDQAAQWLKHPDRIAERAISREPNESASFGFFPLLEISSVEHEGYPTDIYKVAYIGNPEGDSPGKPNPGEPTEAADASNATHAPTAEQLSADFKLQLAFVVDSTASMQPWFDAMKIVVQQIVEKLRDKPELQGRVEFALVTYRDQLDPTDADAVADMQFVADIASNFSGDLAAFGERVGATSVATVGSEDFPEDVLAGLDVAIRELNWGKFAARHVILLGDAPAQISTDGYKNVTKQSIDGILTLAQPTGPNAIWERKQIHGLRVVSEMDDECRQQFDQLTAGRDFAGLHYAYAGTDDAEKFIEDLVNRLSELADVTADITAGRLDKVRQIATNDDTDADLRRLLGPVLPMLRATTESKTPAFTEGYVSTIDPEGNAALEPHALVAQSQLKLFESALNHCVLSLENSGEAGSRDVQKVVQQLQVLATGVNLAEDVHPDMPLHKLLGRALGFPCRSEIFGMTPRKLTAMTAGDFTAWVNQVRASQSICKAHIDSTSAWFTLGANGSRAAEKHAFIKVSDLP